jgi:hypothetical protein
MSRRWILPATSRQSRARHPLVIGIQVFQHGDRAAAHAHIRAAQQRVSPKRAVLPAQSGARM